MRVDIAIPSCKDISELDGMLKTIRQTAVLGERLIVITDDKSAAINRNTCLKSSNAEIIIMLDDDLEGFYPGWDADLIKPMISDEDLQIVCIRPLKTDGTFAENGTGNMSNTPDLIYISKMKEGILPSSCIAFRKCNIMFDEKYRGACFEDADFCFQYNISFPSAKFALNNKCKLIHRNEKKGYTTGGMNNEYSNLNWLHNRYYFYKKWYGKEPW